MYQDVSSCRQEILNVCDEDGDQQLTKREFIRHAMKSVFIRSILWLSYPAWTRYYFKSVKPLKNGHDWFWWTYWFIFWWSGFRNYLLIWELVLITCVSALFDLTFTIKEKAGYVSIWFQYSSTPLIIKHYNNHYSRSNLQSITAPNSVAATRLRLSGPNCTELILPHRALPERAESYGTGRS